MKIIYMESTINYMLNVGKKTLPQVKALMKTGELKETEKNSVRYLLIVVPEVNSE